MTIRIFENGLTIMELKDLLRDYPDRDEDGNHNTVWMETGKGLTSPVVVVAALNLNDDGSSDLLFKSEYYG